MLSNKPSLGHFTVSPSPSFFTVLKFNLSVIALGLFMCLTTFGHSIDGEVYYEHTTATPPKNYIRDAHVCAYTSPGHVFVKCADTGQGGVYFLTGLATGSYDVYVTKNDGEDVNGYITHDDALRVIAHVTGINVFTEESLKWMADASCNGSVSSFDAGKIDNWPSGSYGCTGQWRFLFDDEENPVSVPWPASDVSPPRHYELSGSMGDQNWDAFLKGEVTEYWECPVPTRCNL